MICLLQTVGKWPYCHDTLPRWHAAASLKCLHTTFDVKPKAAERMVQIPKMPPACPVVGYVRRYKQRRF